ncbi:MAG TPA: LytTR family DNA-binding domain-containing protein [Longimicrobiales bacterium]|nr:LytTR family DNA-binding domain-containing protein [Longimicrobiales bacterium]
MLLVDDEPLALENLRVALAAHPDIEIVGRAGDGRAAVRLVRTLDPDLLFLDVQMPDMDGFAVLRELEHVEPPEVVFVTAFDEHAVHAFEVHALDYLLKPFDDARIDECVRRAIRHVRSQRDGAMRHAVSRLLEHVAPASTGLAPNRPGYIERITVRNTSGIIFLAVADVDWFNAAGNYVRIHLGAEEHLIRSTLSELVERLDPHRFVRIHRSIIVNVSRIREVQPWLGGDYLAILHDGRKLKVSRTYRAELLRPLS